MKKVLFVTLLGVLTLTSCKDKVAPEITIASPENHSYHDPSGMIHAEATFSDDKELASYHVHIGDVDGEHVHDWHFESTGNLSGESYDFHEMIMVPDSATLMEHVYYLHFEVVDAEGNTAMDKLMLHIN